MARLSQAQRDLIGNLYDAASRAGLSGPQADLAVMQAIHETGWGRSPSGRNNYHGIKDFSGRGTSRRTWEVENGRRVTKSQPFANYDSLVGSFKGWKGLMERVYPDVVRAQTFEDAVKGLNVGVRGKPSYATDPAYNNRINSVFSLVEPFRPQSRELVDYARQQELSRDIEGLFGPQQATSPSILEGFDLVSNMNLTGVPTPGAKPALDVPTPSAKPSVPGSAVASMQEAAPSVEAVPVGAVERGNLGDITPAAPSRGLLDGFGDLTNARSGIADLGSQAGLSLGSAPGYSRTRDMSMAEYAGLSAPSAAAAPNNVAARQAASGAVPEVSAAPAPSVTASAIGRAGAGTGAVGTFSGRIDQPDEERDKGLMADFAQPGYEGPRTVQGLLGALGAPMDVRQALDQRQRDAQAALPGIDEEIAAAPAIAAPTMAARAMPAMEAPRSIASRTVREAPTAADVKTVAGAVPEVAQNVARYGLNPDPGPGRAYGFSPWGSGVSISYDTAPERVQAAGTGPGLFGAFKDDFGIDLTPSAGLMTGPIAMGLDGLGGAGLFSLGNALGGSKALVDRMDVVDRDTRDRIDGRQSSGGGILGGMFSDPVGSISRQARNELGSLGGLFGWGGGQSSSMGSMGSSDGGGFLSGIGDLLGSIFGGGGDYSGASSRSGSMGGVGSASARGFN